MNAANAAGKPLEGIVFVTIDAAAEGNSPKLQSASGTLGIPGGINVSGTLVFHFINAPDHFYKVFIETPLQRLRLDAYVVWLPLVEVVVIVALVTTSMTRRVGQHDVARDQTDQDGPVVIGEPGALVAADDLGVGRDGAHVVGTGVVAEQGRGHGGGSAVSP